MADRRMPFQKVHDLTALVNSAAQADATLARFAKAVSPLNPFAVGFRYPGAEPRKSDVRRAVRSAGRLRAELRRRLGLRP